MVLNYYKLAEQPFGVTPDPRFLYLSPTHREAMASVLYGVKAGRGFTALIAEPGMGKTTVLFNLLQQLGGSARTAFLFQAQDTPKNFLRNLLSDLGMEDDGQDLVRMQVRLNECLMRETNQGKHFVVLIDEAQNLDEPVLEVVRMLSNFETSREKLMHIILAGQPQLADKLASPQLTQLRQRISIVARLKPFNAQETRGFIDHRLRVAGYREEVSFFTDRAYAMIADYSAGIPRNISNICFNAMSIGCAMRRRTINAAVIEEVLTDLDLKPLSTRVQVAEYGGGASNPAEPEKAVGKSPTIFPKGWRYRAGIASLLAVTAGIGFTVVAKNPHDAASEVDADIAQSAGPSLTQKPANDVARLGDQGQSIANNSRPGHSGAPVPARPANAASTSNAADNFTIQSMTVRIGEQDTLYEICMNHLGRYDQEVVKMIHELNPGFGNPRRLQVGQEIRIPTPRSVSGRTAVSAEGYGSTSALEARKP
jgi:type II secretory pathway predicted ATPase ExeA/phage tail protein X